MIEKTYTNRLQKIVRKFFPQFKNKIFIFGSSLREKQFRDIDIAFIQCPDKKKLYELEEYLEESTFPYRVDLVDFDKTSKEFSDFVLSSEKKLWI